VLRKRDYSNKANYCPACGEQLTVVSVPYLFQVYFHPAIMIIPGILVFLFGMFIFIDVQGCVVEGRKQDAITQKIAADKAEHDLESMPPEWQTLYAGMRETYFRNDKWGVIKNYFKQNKEIQLPPLKPCHIKMFLGQLEAGRDDDAFALISKHIKREE